MASRRLDMSKNPFFPPLTERQSLRRECFLNYFQSFPKQGKPTREPPSSSFINKQNDSSVNRVVDSRHEIRYASLSYEAVKIKSKVRDVTFNSNGNRLICGTKENVLVVSPFTLATECTVNTKSFSSFWHPTSPDIFATISQEIIPSSVKLFDLRAPSNIKSTHDKPVLEIPSLNKDFLFSGCWNPNGNTIAVSDRADCLIAINLAKPIAQPSTKLLANILENSSTEKLVNIDGSKATGATETIYGITFDGLGECFMTYNADGYLNIYPGDPIDLSVEPMQEKLHSSSINCCAVDKRGCFIATGGSDHIVSIFDIETATTIGVYPKLEGQISCLSASYDGQLLAWGTKDSVFTSQENGSYGRGESFTRQDCYLTVAGTNPCEIYFQHRMPSNVVSCSFHPSRCILACGCDYDSMSRGSGYKAHPIDILTFE